MASTWQSDRTTTTAGREGYLANNIHCRDKPSADKTRQDTRQTLSSAHEYKPSATICSNIQLKINEGEKTRAFFYITVGLVGPTTLLYLVELISLKGYTT